MGIPSSLRRAGPSSFNGLTQSALYPARMRGISDTKHAMHQDSSGQQDPAVTQKGAVFHPDWCCASMITNQTLVHPRIKSSRAKKWDLSRQLSCPTTWLEN